MLERLRVVGEIQPVVAQLGEDHLDHEGLEAEAVPLLLHAPRPELHEPDHLREVLLLRALALGGEFEMQRNARLQERAVVLADEIAVPLRVAVVEDRHHVDVEPGAAEGDRHRIGLRLDLVGAEVREGLAQPLGQIVEQRRTSLRRVGAADVAGDVDVVERAKRRALRQAARQQHLLQREPIPGRATSIRSSTRSKSTTTPSGSSAARTSSKRPSPANRSRTEMFVVLYASGAPEEIRTPDPQIRSLVLYPAELRARFRKAYWALTARLHPRKVRRRRERAL